MDTVAVAEVTPAEREALVNNGVALTRMAIHAYISEQITALARARPSAASAPSKRSWSGT